MTVSGAKAKWQAGLAAPELRLTTDVLIIGGGLGGAWAAIGAAEAGASVVLVDKGYFGTSGVTAAAGPGHWWVAPEHRAEAIVERTQRSLGLADPDWMARILDLTWTRLPGLSRYYRFPKDDKGKVQHRSLRGPEYLAGLRRYASDLGVLILDHSPAIELLQDVGGVVTGALGLRRQKDQAWRVDAGAVIIATGGCGFASRLHGSRNNTGDGHLMAAEAGADFSGMEFCNYYVPAAAHFANNRSMLYSFGRFIDAEGHELEIGQVERPERLAIALLKGKVFCTLDKVPEDIQAIMHAVQPNFILPFVRSNIDPWSDWFEVTLYGEGTIRGVGGLRIVDADCQTAVSGLYAVGDAATREAVTGAISGGGAVNSSWALSSGLIAGAAAARRALTTASDTNSGRPIGQAAIRPRRNPAAVDPVAALVAARDEMNPLDKNMFRRGEQLRTSYATVDAAWNDLADHAEAGRDIVQLREAAALNAVARWCLGSANARTETRGMHIRLDRPHIDPRQTERLWSGGLDRPWTRFSAPLKARAATPGLAEISS